MPHRAYGNAAVGSGGVVCREHGKMKCTICGRTLSVHYGPTPKVVHYCPTPKVVSKEERDYHKAQAKKDKLMTKYNRLLAEAGKAVNEAWAAWHISEINRTRGMKP